MNTHQIFRNCAEKARDIARDLERANAFELSPKSALFRAMRDKGWDVKGREGMLAIPVIANAVLLCDRANLSIEEMEKFLQVEIYLQKDNSNGYRNHIPVGTITTNGIHLDYAIEDPPPYKY